MQWRWRKTVYVPISCVDGRTYADKWQTEAYLRSVVAFAKNDVFLSEVGNALSVLRNAADVAKTPEMLAGMNCGIKAIKDLLTAPEKARAALNASLETE